MATRIVFNSNNAVKQCGPGPENRPVWCKIFGRNCYTSIVIANFVLKFIHFCYHGNNGRSFYRAMLAQTAVMRLRVVCPSVCLSVCNV